MHKTTKSALLGIVIGLPIAYALTMPTGCLRAQYELSQAESSSPEEAMRLAEEIIEKGIFEEGCYSCSASRYGMQFAARNYLRDHENNSRN